MDTGESAGRYDNQVTVETFKPEEAVIEAPKVEEPEAVKEAEDVSHEAEPKQKKPGFKEKLERTKAELAEVRAQFESFRQKAEKPQAAEEIKGEKEPKVDDFETYDAYYEAKAKHTARQEFAKLKAEDEAKSKETDLRKQAEAQRDKFAAAAQDFMKENPDFEDLIEEAGLAEVPQLGMVLMESDMGPELAYHLAKNPEDLEQLKGMTYTQKAKFIGKLEARLEKAVTPEVKAPAKEVKVSKAPPPINPVGKTATTAVYDPYTSTGDDTDKYMEWRAKQKR